MTQHVPCRCLRRRRFIREAEERDAACVVDMYLPSFACSKRESNSSLADLSKRLATAATVTVRQLSNLCRNPCPIIGLTHNKANVPGEFFAFYR
jgi:hypothetical protein